MLRSRAASQSRSQKAASPSCVCLTCCPLTGFLGPGGGAARIEDRDLGRDRRVGADHGRHGRGVARRCVVVSCSVHTAVDAVFNAVVVVVLVEVNE